MNITLSKRPFDSCKTKQNHTSFALASSEVLSLPYKCPTEAYAYDPTAHTLTLTNLKTKGDCVGKVVSPFSVTSLAITWDPAKDTLGDPTSRLKQHPHSAFGRFILQRFLPGTQPARSPSCLTHSSLGMQRPPEHRPTHDSGRR